MPEITMRSRINYFNRLTHALNGNLSQREQARLKIEEISNRIYNSPDDRLFHWLLEELRNPNLRSAGHNSGALLLQPIDSLIKVHIAGFLDTDGDAHVNTLFQLFWDHLSRLRHMDHHLLVDLGNDRTKLLSSAFLSRIESQSIRMNRKLALCNVREQDKIVLHMVCPHISVFDSISDALDWLEA